ncbi:MAG: hypothetical protein JWO51_4287 [Rhodospirillales bacterium]|jgi:hypothetical protein|nr:hypothetical protein [Rhodospirillales bacterium]
MRLVWIENAPLPWTIPPVLGVASCIDTLKTRALFPPRFKTGAESLKFVPGGQRAVESFGRARATRQSSARPVTTLMMVKSTPDRRPAVAMCQSASSTDG